LRKPELVDERTHLVGKRCQRSAPLPHLEQSVNQVRPAAP
jgi:hypothetical protein